MEVQDQEITADLVHCRRVRRSDARSIVGMRRIIAGMSLCRLCNIEEVASKPRWRIVHRASEKCPIADCFFAPFMPGNPDVDRIMKRRMARHMERVHEDIVSECPKFQKF